MQIYLSKPDADREGPFSLEQVNEALASQRYQVSDYWAWYEGLADWVPLASVPGIQEAPEPAAPITQGYQTQVFTAAPANSFTPGFQTQVFTAATVQAAAAATQAATASADASPADDPRLPAGMPFSALEQIFILTTGEGHSASRSSVTISLLEGVIGADWETIRMVVPRDAIAKCTVLNEMGKGPVPSMVWRAMTAFKPTVLQQAREGLYRICTRTFRIETGDLVSVFLFYNKQKV